ncbi:hypothetical protein DHEL01_v212098 [Diaporthe helianthi]|uniref:DUF6604 domain-containing protein n=1 Tax=Diaporthe helianthi TaxID=158607 RepID=A0A2P5HGX9_DIAHE|nr:hypothetical protein DHEL01_v212098 [Diaporthe helianthi]
MLPATLSTKYGRYKSNQDDLATFLAVTGTLCGAPATLTKPLNPSSDDTKSARPKGKDRKLAKQRAAAGSIDQPTRQRAPKLALSSYVPLAEVIAKSSSVHGSIPKWIITVIDKIINDREDCFRHINGDDVAVFLAKGQQDGHIHPINVLARVRSILAPKHIRQVARAQNVNQPRTPTKKVLGEVSGNATAKKSANMFAELRLKSPESSPSSNSESSEHKSAVEAEDLEKADAWRTSLAPAQVFAAYPEASREEAWLALGSLRDEMLSIRRAVLKQWRGWKNGDIDLAAAAVTTNTAIDLVRSLEKQAKPVIESYTTSLDAKETQLPVYWYSLGTWIKDINDKTCGTNLYAPLLGTGTESHTDCPQDFSTPNSAKYGIDEYDEWLQDSQSFRWAYTLVQLYCMEFFTKVNPTYKRPPGSEPMRFGNGARPDDAKLFEQVRTCRGHDIQWLYELSFMGNYGVGPVFPFIDEVSRGFRIMHEDVDIKLWAVFGVQLFWDVNELLGVTNRAQPFQVLNSFLDGGLDLFEKAHTLYTSAIFVEPGEEVEDEPTGPSKTADMGHTVLMCLLPQRLDEEIENMGHTSYPNLNKCYLMTCHPILCGILLHAARLMQQECGIVAEKYTRSIMKMAHIYNACVSYNLLTACWYDLEYCMKELQGPNIFMLGKLPDNKTQDAFGKAFLFAAGGISLAYTAPDCRDRQGRRGQRFADEHFKFRKKGPGKALQKLGPVSLMFEDRFCRCGDRYELNEEDLQAITERAAAYKLEDIENRQNRSATNPKTSRSIAKKSKSVAQLLADLSLGLDQEVSLISFPYICLNVECAKVIWKTERLLLSMHPELHDSDSLPPSFGSMMLHFLTGDCDKLWIAAGEIHNYIGDDTPGTKNGSVGLAWMMENIRLAPSAGIADKMQEYKRREKDVVITTDVDSHVEEAVTCVQEKPHQKPKQC